MSSSGRIRARIIILNDDLTPTSGGENRIALEYGYPFVDVSSPSNTVKHETVSESMDSVVQHMGAAIRDVNVQGICYLDEANFIDTLNEGGLIRLICDRRVGDYVVNNADTRAKGDGGGKRPSTGNRRFDYTLSLSEIRGDIPSQSSIL